MTHYPFSLTNISGKSMRIITSDCSGKSWKKSQFEPIELKNIAIKVAKTILKTSYLSPSKFSCTFHIWNISSHLDSRRQVNYIYKNNPKELRPNKQFEYSKLEIAFSGDPR
jgi:hypothetical protein